VATKELAKKKGSRSFFQYIKRSKDQVLLTVLFEDYAALLGLSIAGAGMGMYLLTDNVVYDTIATLLIGALLVAIAILLYKEAKSLLVGESASPEDQEKISNAFTDHPQVEKLTELLTMHLSVDQILVNAHVKFKAGLKLEEVEAIIDEIEDKIISEVPEVFKIFIETHQKGVVSPLQKSGEQESSDEKQRKSVIRKSGGPTNQDKPKEEEPK
jgi:divalent metal cation (Fe/Co/Zn/Cd) transporter